MKNPFLLDFYELISKADAIRQQKWGRKTFFVRNLHLNYTNICVSHCRFCAFAKNKNEDGSYNMTPDDAVTYVSKKGGDATEIHIVGGLHPDYDFNYYVDMIRLLKESYPNKTIKAFSAVEINYFSEISGLPISKVLQKLKSAGLEMMPGGGAEILNDKVRSIICPEKISGKRWLEIHEIAHKEGIVTNATMLYGHIETDEDKFEHLLAIRDLQEKTKGFSAFIPLSFQPENTFLSDRPYATGIEDIKAVASSRIVLENVPHIKAYWVMLGMKTAQIALRAGADDLDGTIVKENIAHAAGGKTDEAMSADDLARMVKAAGLIPVERDSFYGEVKIYD